jgi:hypothetical protein
MDDEEVSHRRLVVEELEQAVHAATHPFRPVRRFSDVPCDCPFGPGERFVEGREQARLAI